MAQPGVLSVIGGNDRGKRFDLTLPENRIGRGTDQDVVLSDIAVSRRHVSIMMEGGRYRVRDHGSGNGTLVNGQRVQTHLLNDGDVIEIGQTVMRFDHAASRGVSSASPNMPTMGQPQPAPLLPPPSPQQAFAPTMAPPPPQPRPYSGASPTVQPPAPQVGPPSFGAPMPLETPSDAISMPTAMPARPVPLTGQVTGAGGLAALLDTPIKQALVFGAMGFLCIVSIITILARTVFAKPPVVASEAEELYKQGLHEFAGGDYERAKVMLAEALKLAPDSTEIARYATLCDAEVHAAQVIKTAQRALAGRQYDEAMRALATVDSQSAQYDQAQRMRRENAGPAARALVDEARRMLPDDTDGARAKLADAVALDPSNAEAQSMLAKLRSGGVPVATKEPDEAPPATAPPSRHDHHAKDELAPVKAPKPVATKEPKEPKESSGGGGSALSGAALAAYKSKDFASAERLTRMEAMKQDAKAAQKTLDTANQVRNLKGLLDKAGADEAKSPDAAIKEYNDAIAIDAKIGKGANAAFFKSKIGHAEVASAQAAFNAGKYDVAYNTITSAQRHGGGDGGLPKQLEAKAAELVGKGQALQKSNLNQAKTYWRMVIKMVPTTSPSYGKAYGLLNAGGGGHKDEDEN